MAGGEGVPKFGKRYGEEYFLMEVSAVGEDARDLPLPFEDENTFDGIAGDIDGEPVGEAKLGRRRTQRLRRKEAQRCERGQE
jgi:hypothetical protein